VHAEPLLDQGVLTLFEGGDFGQAHRMMRLTEDQYEVIRPLLPVQRENVRIANLDVINAVL
jgi:hypothetical protein